MKKLLLSFVVMFSLALGFGNALATVSAANPNVPAKDAVCEGVSGVAGTNCAGGGKALGEVVGLVLTIISIVAGVAAVFMIMISGFRYITSGGDAQAVAKAKTTLIYAIVGLIVVAVSQFLVHFVLKNVT